MDQAAKQTVLAIDDTAENLTLINGLLKDSYKIKVANSGARGLELALAAPAPDLILLDIMMPEMDGFEVMRRLRENFETRDIPVIFITALADMENEIKALEAGAVDYITKPFNPPVVRSRVATHLALRRARQTLELRNKALLQERMLVEDVIIRMRASKLFDDRHLRYLVAPVDRANGDILLATFTPDGRQWVLVGDFTGHGLRAAVAAPLAAHVFYSHAVAGGDIEAAITAINDVLCRQLPTEIFMAGVAVEVAATRDAVRLWNAGMPECLLLGADRSVRKVVAPTGIPPLGIVPAIDVQGGQERFAARPGDAFYIFSDGITETASAAGELFGLQRVEGFLGGLAAGAPLEDLSRVLADFHGASVFDDDITLVEIGL